MVIKGQLEIPNEEGTGFDVLFSDTTVADVLQAHKAAIDGMSSTYAKKADVASAMHFYIGTATVNNYTAVTASGLTGAWKLIKFSYASGKLNLSVSGNSTKTLSMTIAREPRRLVFGGFTGYVDDFELVDNGVVKSKLNFE